MFCQDDIKIARETHYGSLYIDASGRKYLGQNSRRVKSIGRLGLDWTQTSRVLALSNCNVLEMKTMLVMIRSNCVVIDIAFILCAQGWGGGE